MLSSLRERICALKAVNFDSENEEEMAEEQNQQDMTVTIVRHQKDRPDENKAPAEVVMDTPEHSLAPKTRGIHKIIETPQTPVTSAFVQILPVTPLSPALVNKYPNILKNRKSDTAKLNSMLNT